MARAGSRASFADASEDLAVYAPTPQALRHVLVSDKVSVPLLRPELDIPDFGKCPLKPFPGRAAQARTGPARLRNAAIEPVRGNASHSALASKPATNRSTPGKSGVAS